MGERFSLPPPNFKVSDCQTQVGLTCESAGLTGSFTVLLLVNKLLGFYGKKRAKGTIGLDNPLAKAAYNLARCLPGNLLHELSILLVFELEVSILGCMSIKFKR